MTTFVSMPNYTQERLKRIAIPPVSWSSRKGIREFANIKLNTKQRKPPFIVVI